MAEEEVIWVKYNNSRWAGRVGRCEAGARYGQAGWKAVAWWEGRWQGGMEGW